jgi:hypothetical protein
LRSANVVPPSIERVVKPYRGGRSSDDMEKVDSDGHRKVLAAFVTGIEKRPADQNGPPGFASRRAAIVPRLRWERLL